MFRRRWSSLPADPEFPADLKKLGYFVNNVDEIRSIENHNNYYHYFFTKNMRWNDRKRFAMNQAVASLIEGRLENLGLVKTILPIGTPVDEPHVPILVSRNLSTADRVIVIFGEAFQDMGVIAQRIVGGPGGVTKGSMISVIQAIQKGDAGGEGGSVGIVLANPGQLWWWPEGKRGLNPRDRFSLPMQSAVHRGRRYDARLNAVPGHETVGRHVQSVFEEVLGKMTRRDAKLAVMAVTDVADDVEKYLDDEDTWKKWEDRMECLALISNFYGSTEPIKCEGFKSFLAERARSWIHDGEAAVDMPLANPEGSVTRVSVGCPLYSAGPEAYIPELLMIYTYPAVLKFFREVSADDNFCNPRYEIYEALPRGDAHYWTAEDYKDDDDSKQAGGGLEAIDEEQKEEKVAGAEKSDLDKSPKANVEKKDSAEVTQDTSAPSAERILPSIEHDSQSTKDDSSPILTQATTATGVNNDRSPSSDTEATCSVPSDSEHIPSYMEDDNPDTERAAVRDLRARCAKGEVRESDYYSAPGVRVQPGPDDRPIRERIRDLERIVDERIEEEETEKEKARKMEEEKKKSKEMAEKDRIEFMRREVLHTLGQVEDVVLRTIAEGGGKRGGDESEEEDTEEYDDHEEEDDDDENNEEEQEKEKDESVL